MSKNNLNHAVGRRKTSVARVYLRKGNGKIIINGRDMKDYFTDFLLHYIVTQPLVATAMQNNFDICVTVRGGGFKGQAGAVCHGIARVLQKYDENNTAVLRNNGFLTRDDRMVERKKYGQRGARRSFQFAKR